MDILNDVWVFMTGWWFFQRFLEFSSRKLGKMNPIWLIFRRSGSKPLASGSAGPPGGCYSSRELGDPSKKHQALAGAALLWPSCSCETFVPWYFLHCFELGRDQLRNQTAHSILVATWTCLVRGVVHAYSPTPVLHMLCPQERFVHEEGAISGVLFPWVLCYVNQPSMIFSASLHLVLVFGYSIAGNRNSSLDWCGFEVWRACLEQWVRLD